MEKGMRQRRHLSYSLLAALIAASSQVVVAQERPAAFVDAAKVVPGLIVEMRYADRNSSAGGSTATRCRAAC